MRYIAIVFLGFILGGCITTKVPAKSEYRIDTSVSTLQSDGKKCHDKTLKIAQAFSTKSLMSNDMMYAQGDFKQYVYSASQWAQTPNEIITREILSLLRETMLFQSVQPAKSRSRSDFVLEINIEDFMQYFNESSTKSYVNAVVSLTFIDARSHKVYAAKTFNAKFDVNTMDAQGGVEALTEALENILKDSNVWINGVCK